MWSVQRAATLTLLGSSPVGVEKVRSSLEPEKLPDRKKTEGCVRPGGESVAPGQLSAQGPLPIPASILVAPASSSDCGPRPVIFPANVAETPTLAISQVPGEGHGSCCSGLCQRYVCHAGRSERAGCIGRVRRDQAASSARRCDSAATAGARSQHSMHGESCDGCRRRAASPGQGHAQSSGYCEHQRAPEAS